MSEEVQRKPSYTPEIVVGIGYLLFIVVLIVLCGAALVLANAKKPTAGVAAPTSSLPLTPTPHIRATPAPSDPGVLADDFSTNNNGWNGYYWQTNEAHVRDGKLLIESKADNSYAIATCGKCLHPIRPYYLQAELSTDEITDTLIGILIRTRYQAQDFYAFGINTEARQYFFERHDNKGWFLRAAGISHLIRAFPAPNTLGLYVSGAEVELYINDSLVDTYRESGMVFESGLIGFFAEGSGYQLEVDNLAVKAVGE
jgi:hypothetical protein